MVDGVPTGFRFYPTEAELVGFYLRNKLDNTRPDMERFVPVVDVYSFEPTELPQRSGEASVGDPEQWFFFCPRQQREARGGRPTRTTRLGYWKATGSPTPVFHNNRVIGIKKTMVFYHGRPPTGRKTAWKMNEYRATTTQQASTSTSKASLELRSEFSVCRVYKKSGPLRSFDRRPVMGAMAGGNAGDGQPRRPPAGTSSSSQGNSASAAVDREPSQGSSPSDGGQDPGPVDATGGGDDDWEMQLEGVDWDSLADFDDI